MTRNLNIGQAFNAWPAIDRELWGQAFEGNDIFDDRVGKPLAPSTKQGRKYAYGLWLGFLEAFEPEMFDRPPGKRVNRRTVEDYVDLLRDNCTETTVAHALLRLFYVIRVFCPNDDWNWLYRVGRRIMDQAVPVAHPPVLSSDLYRVGIRAIERAEGMAKKAGTLTKSAVVRYRDGMLIATLVEAPTRRKPFSLIEIGKHLKKEGRYWVISIPAEITKTNIDEVYPLSERLSRHMDVFLKRIRPAFPGADEYQRLWPYEGRPMTDKMIRRRIIKRTEEGLGFPVPPHRFRNAAATFIATADPENIRVAKDLLGHKSFAMTEKHYIDAAQSRKAGREFSAILDNLARSTIMNG